MRHALRAALAALILAGWPGSAAMAGPSLVVDAASGAVLHQEDATRPWFPASLTKLMTAYVVFKAIEAGRIEPGTPIAVSRAAARQAPSKMGYPAGTLVTVDDALKMIIVKSANDISVALAEGVSGSVPAFVEEMNRYSRALGMRETRWANPNGLPNPQQVTSARDMAILARAILSEFPQYQALFRIHAIQSGKRVMRTHNALIYRYPGADGMKTGFICASGFNVVATATRGNQRLITVVMGAPSAKERAVIAARLFEDAFGGGGGWFSGGGGLAALAPSRFTSPTNIRGEVCGRNRSSRAAEAEVDDGFDDWNLPGGAAASDNAILAAIAPAPGAARQPQRRTRVAAGSSPYLRNEWSLRPPVRVGPYTGERAPSRPEAPAAVDEATPAVAAVDNPDAAAAVALLQPIPMPRPRPGAIVPLEPAAVAAERAANEPIAFSGERAGAGVPLELPGALGAIRPVQAGTAAPRPAALGQIAAVAGNPAEAAFEALGEPAAEVPMPPPRPGRQAASP